MKNIDMIKDGKIYTLLVVNIKSACIQNEQTLVHTIAFCLFVFLMYVCTAHWDLVTECAL